MINQNIGGMEAKKIKSKMELKRRLFVLSFCMLPVINFLVFYVYLNFNAILASFQTTTRFETTWGFENYSRFFEELASSSAIFSEAFRNTFITFGIQMLLFPVGLIVAYLFYKKIFAYNVIRTIFFLPTVLAATIVSSVFMQIVGVGGPIAPMVQKFAGLDYVPTLLADSRYANLMIFLELIWLGIPGDMIIWGGALSRIPNSVLEAAELDGVSWWQELWLLIVPLIWPTFSMKILLSVTGIFGATGSVFLLTKGDYGTMTLNCWMYLQVYQLNGNVKSNAINYLSAVGVMITLVSMVLAFVIRKITKKMEEVQY